MNEIVAEKLNVAAEPRLPNKEPARRLAHSTNDAKVGDASFSFQWSATNQAPRGEMSLKRLMGNSNVIASRRRRSICRRGVTRRTVAGALVSSLAIGLARSLCGRSPPIQ